MDQRTKMLLCLFAFKTECIHYTTESIKIAYENTSVETKAYYEQLVDKFLLLKHTFDVYEK